MKIKELGVVACQIFMKLTSFTTKKKQTKKLTLLLVPYCKVYRN